MRRLTSIEWIAEFRLHRLTAGSAGDLHRLLANCTWQSAQPSSRFIERIWKIEIGSEEPLGMRRDRKHEMAAELRNGSPAANLGKIGEPNSLNNVR